MDRYDKHILRDFALYLLACGAAVGLALITADAIASVVWRLM